jgi:hypothetical protein
MLAASVLIWLGSFHDVRIVGEVNVAGGEYREVFQSPVSEEVLGFRVTRPSLWETNLDDNWKFVRFDYVFEHDHTQRHFGTGYNYLGLLRLTQYLDDQDCSITSKQAALDKYGALMATTIIAPRLTYNDDEVHAQRNGSITIWPMPNTED